MAICLLLHAGRLLQIHGGPCQHSCSWEGLVDVPSEHVNKSQRMKRHCFSVESLSRIKGDMNADCHNRKEH